MTSSLILGRYLVGLCFADRDRRLIVVSYELASAAAASVLAALMRSARFEGGRFGGTISTKTSVASSMSRSFGCCTVELGLYSQPAERQVRLSRAYGRDPTTHRVCGSVPGFVSADDR
jgi:hypothetical protein